MPTTLHTPDPTTSPLTGVPPSQPSTARLSNYWLDGKDNYDTDLHAAHHIAAVTPAMPLLERMNRIWLADVVATLSATGTHQFLDLGAGIPHEPHLHHIAGQHLRPPQHRVLVISVDSDIVVVRHGQALIKDRLTGTGAHAATLHADLTDPDTVLRLAQRKGLDLAAPVAILLSNVLHHIDTDRIDIPALTGTYTDLLTPGSHLAISHYHQPPPDTQPTTHQLATDLQHAFLHSIGTGWFRPRAQIESYFAGLPLLHPGLTNIGEAHDHSTPTLHTDIQTLLLRGVARKP